MSNQQTNKPSEDAQTQAIMDQILLSLADKAKKDKDNDSQILTLTHSHSQHSQPADNAEPEDLSNDSDEEPHEVGATLEKATTEETFEYPPPAQGALVMLALLLALFLSALVSRSCPM
jgi:hypothetical protein